MIRGRGGTSARLLEVVGVILAAVGFSTAVVLGVIAPILAGSFWGFSSSSIRTMAGFIVGGLALTTLGILIVRYSRASDPFDDPPSADTKSFDSG